MKLSDAKCRNARPKERPYELADGHGLSLLVGANGSRLWRLDCRFDGKRLTMAIGAYPDTTLADAREARDAARKHLRDGRDPMEERKVSRTVARVARATTFGLVADELLAKLTREGKAEVTIAKRRWLLHDLGAPLCTRPVAAITPAEVLGLLRDIEAKGHLETARRLKASIGQVMRLAVATNRAQFDPTPSLTQVAMREGRGGRESARVTLIDPHPLDRQAEYPGPTWLDRIADGRRKHVQFAWISLSAQDASVVLNAGAVSLQRPRRL